jgi:hypothetical protein
LFPVNGLWNQATWSSSALWGQHAGYSC